MSLIPCAWASVAGLPKRSKVNHVHCLCSQSCSFDGFGGLAVPVHHVYIFVMCVVILHIRR